MSSVLDDKKAKAGEEYIEQNGKRYKKVNFDEIPNNHEAARAAGYTIFRNSNGGIIGALEGAEAKNKGNYFARIGGEWYEVVDNPIAKKAGRTFDIAQPTAAVTPAKETSTPAAQPATTEQARTPAPAAVATEAASQKEEMPAAPDTQASDDVIALEEVDILGNRSQKKEPETTFPKNVSPFDIRGTRIPNEGARNAGVSKLDNYYHRSVLETLPETPAAQSRYDKAIADIEAAKSPSRLKRYHIREMNEERGGYPYYYREDVPHVAGRGNWSAEELRKLIEDGKKRKETEPQQTPASKEEAPTATAQPTTTTAEQSAVTAQTPVVKEEVPVATTQTPAPAEQSAVEDAVKNEDGGKMTILWPDLPEMEMGNYVEQTDAQIAQAQKSAAEQERRAKRDRDMAILSDIANLVTKGAAMHGGAWKIDKEEARSAVANEKLRALRESNSKLLAEYARRRMAAQDAQRKERNAEKKAEYDAAVAQSKWEADNNYRNARLKDGESYHNALLGIQGAREERLKNQGGGSGSSNKEKKIRYINGMAFDYNDDKAVVEAYWRMVEANPNLAVMEFDSVNGYKAVSNPSVNQMRGALGRGGMTATPPSANNGKKAGFSSGKKAGFK